MRANVIANWPDHIVTGQDDEKEDETEPERPNFIWLYVDDFGEDAVHVNDEARMSNDEGMTKPKELVVVRTFELISSFVMRISSFLSSSTRQALPLRVLVRDQLSHAFVGPAAAT